jgi:hypothetical protein
LDYEAYRRAYFVDPHPPQKYHFTGIGGISLYISDYEAAISFYSQVLGRPAYVEGEFTRGWPIGENWLSIFPAESGAPRNTDFTVIMNSPAEAEKLQQAFFAAGGEGAAPSDQLMYTPIRFCPVQDPFGTQILIVAPSESQ